MSGRVRPHSRGQSHAHVAVRQRGVRLPVLQLWSLSTRGGPGSPRAERRCYPGVLAASFQVETGDRGRRLTRFDYDALAKRDKINLDIFWLKDDSLDDPDLLPPPDEIAAEIVEGLEAALDRFRKVAASLAPAIGQAAE